MLPAVLALVAVWLVVAALLDASPVPAATARDASTVAAQPLWFLAVYLLLVLVAPLQLRLHRRRRWLLLLLAPPLAVGLDVLRLQGVAGALSALSYLVVFVVAQELGLLYADGALQRVSARRHAGTAATALLVLVLLTTLGPYPVSMVGVPGEQLSNMAPPTVCVVVVTVLQVSLLLSLRPRLLRWAHRPRVWAAVVLSGRVVLTVFLWHLSAFVVGAALLGAGAGLVAAPGTAGWWLAKPLYLVVSAGVLAVLVLALSRVERRERGRPAVRRTAVGVLGLVLAVAGLAAVAASGFLEPFHVQGRAVLGLRASPVVGAVLLLLGSALTVPSGSPGRRAVRG